MIDPEHLQLTADTLHMTRLEVLLRLRRGDAYVNRTLEEVKSWEATGIRFEKPPTQVERRPLTLDMLGKPKSRTKKKPPANRVMVLMKGGY
jgi:hypothetical protein